MQGLKRRVNDYVVIIFSHYIKCFDDGRMRKNVTWASFWERRVASVASQKAFLVCSVLLAQSLGKQGQQMLTGRFNLHLQQLIATGLA